MVGYAIAERMWGRSENCGMVGSAPSRTYAAVFGFDEKTDRWFGSCRLGFRIRRVRHFVCHCNIIFELFTRID